MKKRPTSEVAVLYSGGKKKKQNSHFLPGSKVKARWDPGSERKVAGAIKKESNVGLSRKVGGHAGDWGIKETSDNAIGLLREVFLTHHARGKG